MFNGKDMDGRVVTVRFDRRSKPKSRRRVFVDAAEGASAPTPSDAPVTVTAKTNRVYVGNVRCVAQRWYLDLTSNSLGCVNSSLGM